VTLFHHAKEAIETGGCGGRQLAIEQWLFRR